MMDDKILDLTASPVWPLRVAVGDLLKKEVACAEAFRERRYGQALQWSGGYCCALYDVLTLLEDRCRADVQAVAPAVSARGPCPVCVAKDEALVAANEMASWLCGFSTGPPSPALPFVRRYYAARADLVKLLDMLAARDRVAHTQAARAPAALLRTFLSVHDRHCCRVHGCKYGERDCPVVRGVELGIACDDCLSATAGA